MTNQERNMSIVEQFHILVQANSQLMSFLQHLAHNDDNNQISEEETDRLIQNSLMASSIFMHRLITNLFPDDVDIEEIMDNLDKAWQNHANGAQKMAEVDMEIKRMMRDL